MDRVSVVIPARNEIYLQKTIEDVLANARGDIEVIVELDGWTPDPSFDTKDSRVTFYHHPKSIGHRACTNHAAKVATGKYIMKLDAHCSVDSGFDVKLQQDCEYDWTVIPRMYNLDVETWKPRLIDEFPRAVRKGKLHDYMYMAVNDKGELRAEYYTNGNVTLHMGKKDILIDDIMCCMGPCFFMHKDRFWELGGCDEWMGGWGQQAVEISCKAWLSGGSLKVNKKTWFAHWFRADQGWPYPISGKQINRTRRETTDFWMNNRWPLAKRKFQWMIDKFNPPGEVKPKKVEPMETRGIYQEIRRVTGTSLRGDFSPIACRRGDRKDLIPLMHRIGYKTGVEIGVQRADFSQLMLSGMPDLHLHCIDPWDVYKDSRLSERLQVRYKTIAYRRLDRFIKDGRCTVHEDYSENVAPKFKDGSLDFVYIDGMHTFDGCILDLVKWCPKVRKGGMVIVHDYEAGRRQGVVQAVNAYVYCHMIHPWFVTRSCSLEKRERPLTAFWVVE